MKRPGLLKLRKTLVEKCMNLIFKCQLFKENALYPKRYFDDIVIEGSVMDSTINSIYQDGGGERDPTPLNEPFPKQLPFVIGQKDEFKQAALASMNNTHSTLSDGYNDSKMLDNKYSRGSPGGGRNR